MTSRFGKTVAFVVLGLGLLSAAGGCSSAEEGPRTYPVRGQVEVKKGDVKSLVGGYVRLASADGTVIGVGEIQDDGTFGIGTFVDGKPRGGLPEGEYRARVEPRGFDERDSDDQPPSAKKGEVLQKYQKYETSGLKYTIRPGDNTITVEVEVRR